jgi:Raf kinase inhibitor-like YbhB/YbcL family protein
MWWRPVIFAVIATFASTPASASSFTLETSAFLNDGSIPKLDAAQADSCGGRNVSPPLHLIGFPAATRSFAILVFDPDGGGGRGYAHWIAYGIAPSSTQLQPGFGSQASTQFTGGMNDAGTTIYSGPCPPPGDAPHRYVFTVYALDLPPERLRRGLTRLAFLKAVAGHTLATAQITGRYGR